MSKNGLDTKVTGYEQDDQGSISNMNIFVIGITSRPAMEPIQLYTQWAPGNLSSGLKSDPCESEHLDLFCGGLGYMGHMSVILICFMA
jgi:hypothetical protein